MRQSAAAPRTLAWIACALAFFLVAFGAFVRLSDAGLSCPDWPTCYGQITWPAGPAAVAHADRAFPNRPFDAHRAWREQTHRFLAGTLGLLVLLLALKAAFRARRCFELTLAAAILIAAGLPLYIAGRHAAAGAAGALGEAMLLAVAAFWPDGGWRRVAVLALALVCFQALLGMWTVTWLLLPAVVTAHLLGGLATFSILTWLAARSSLRDPPGSGRTLLLPTAIGLLLLSAQIFLGGWTSSNYAGLACGVGGTAFPRCLGQWWPPMDMHAGFVLWRHIGVDYQGGILDSAARTAIQMAHRIGAMVVLLYGLWLARRVVRSGLRWHGALLALALVTQVALGIANVVFGLPLWVAEAHTIGAVLLLGVLVVLLARSREREHAVGHPPGTAPC